MSKKRALITGITGQDGFYLTDLLLTYGYDVFGLVRRQSNPGGLERLQPLMDNADTMGSKVQILSGDLTDSVSVLHAIEKAEPSEIYNLAAQPFVPESWASPLYTFSVNTLGFVNVLESVRSVGADIRVYQASTSEMFGNATPPDLDSFAGFSSEDRMAPRSPYGASKLAAHRTAAVYRDSYNMYISCGILFNHESPIRPREFVTRKITRQIGEMVLGRRKVMRLGNMEARRDWGFAGDYVEAMHKMLQVPAPVDCVVGTGLTFSISHFVAETLMQYYILLNNPSWSDAFSARQRLDWRTKASAMLEAPNDYIVSDDKYKRPAEVDYLRADPTEAIHKLEWRAQTNLADLVTMMVKEDFHQLVREQEQEAS